MADIRMEFVMAAFNRVIALSDYNNDFNKFWYTYVGNYEHNYDLAMKIVDGVRPKITSAGDPPEYDKLMKQCWDADPLKRPIDTLSNEILKMWKDSYNEYTNEFNNIKSDNSSQISQTNSSLSSLST
ncbi:hypothetical protein C1645_875695, partial [Glomus cerebriforme]